MDFTGIRHIIFDFGGVIINLDYQATERAFASLGVADFSKHYAQLAQGPLFDDLETGRIGGEAFVVAMKNICGQNITEAQITDAWNAMLLDIPLRRLQLLQQLRNQFDLFLLSNTNEIHEAAFNQTLKQTCGAPSLAAFFDKVYFSHRIGMRKPGREVFLYILEENGLKPEHTLFIDDSPQHVQTAAELGIRTIHLLPGMTIEGNIFLPKNSK